MSYYCEVCNGMTALAAVCPRCRGHADDCGRYNDFLGPYAPYRAIDDISLSNGFADIRMHECIHMMLCTNCGHTFHYSVRERQSAGH